MASLHPPSFQRNDFSTCREIGIKFALLVKNDITKVGGCGSESSSCIGNGYLK